MKKLLPIIFLALFLSACSWSINDNLTTPPTSGSPYLLQFHNGSVLHNSKTIAVFWGTNWPNLTDTYNGLVSFLQGLQNSSYIGIADEYYDSSGYLSSSATYQGYYFMNSTSPSLDDTITSQNTLENAVCSAAGDNPDPDTIYVVFTDNPQTNNSNFCGYHLNGYCGSNPVVIAYIPYLNGEPGCNPYDNTSGHSEELSAAANVTAHEIMEIITDPMGNGWYDSHGNEIGDKCGWTFSNNLIPLSNGTSWKLQTEWSNKAYEDGSGIANGSGQKGCAYQ